MPSVVVSRQRHTLTPFVFELLALERGTEWQPTGVRRGSQVASLRSARDSREGLHRAVLASVEAS